MNLEYVLGNLEAHVNLESTASDEDGVRAQEDLRKSNLAKLEVLCKEKVKANKNQPHWDVKVVPQYTHSSWQKLEK